ncbi:serine/threonine-protein kinase [Ktedonobacter racemifer]|uniref:non-specific serine/threonine protein kinase n=1 Tax=Ktedonobacter racemifer DSM 44963 TaxID=485913 RepID=D6TEU7_KTERA|nr:serine/threonine-protein kinase [Ktedonobacter racemifer]EFH88546.1 serine/threonine protein kinase [Ktedonobacter racemifer DSM 44963]
MKLWRYNRAFETLGQRYELLGSLGSGGMADVCLAWDEHDQREVAIKVIKPDELDQRTLDRFVKEAAKVAQWKHPNILHIYSDLKLELVDPTRGSMIPYIVMEYAAGGDLHKRLRPGQPYPLNKILTLAPQLCSAVAYAHAHGVIHRDLKPLNILFRALPDGSEQAVLSDFGLAVEVSATHHTFPGGGTLPYMAPEQFRGGALPQSDIFALGVILYQLCTGRLPFRHTLFEVGRDLARQQQLTPPPRPSSLQPLLSPDLDAVILRALAHDPTQRYQDAEALWDDFRSVAHTNKGSIPPSRSDPKEHMVRGYSMGAYLDRESITPVRYLFIEDVEESDIESSGENLSITPAPKLRPKPRPVVLPSSARRSRSGMENSPITPALRPTLLKHASTYNGTGRVVPILLAALLVLILVTGVIFALPGLRDVSGPIATLLNGNRATIALTTSSHLEQHTYQVTGVPTNPDAAQSQVQAHPLTTSAQSTTQTIQGTGKKQTAGTRATGILTFFNGSFTTPFVVASGTQVSTPNGLTAITDAPISIPAADPNRQVNGQGTITAHITQTGTQGNIPALTINKICCKTDNSVFVKNANPFTGGQDPQNYTFVTQQDVDGVSGGLQNSAQAQALQQLHGMLQGGEEMAGDPQCKNTINYTNPIGDTGANVASTTISVTVSCNAFTYSRQQMQGLVAPQLQDKANNDLGAGYKLIGQIQTRPVQQRQNGDTVTWVIEAQGTWAYQFDVTAQQALARLIAGKNPAEAQTLLQNTHGVARANIQFNGATLPNDPNQITFTITNQPKPAPQAFNPMGQTMFMPYSQRTHFPFGNPIGATFTARRFIIGCSNLPFTHQCPLGKTPSPPFFAWCQGNETRFRMCIAFM